MIAGLPADATEDERMLAEVVERIVADRVAPVAGDWDGAWALDPAVVALLEEQGLVETDMTQRMHLLIVERLARGSAALAAAVAARHEVAAAAGEGQAGAALADGWDDPLLATPDGDGWRLDGRAPRVEGDLSDDGHAPRAEGREGAERGAPSGAVGERGAPSGEGGERGAPSGAGEAGSLVVLAQDQEGTALVLEVGVRSDGVEIGEAEATTGLRGRTVRAVSFDAAPAQRLRGPDGARAARQQRALTACALAAGVSAAAHAEATTYAAERRQFGAPIASFGGVRALLTAIEAGASGIADGLWRAAGQPVAAAEAATGEPAARSGAAALAAARAISACGAVTRDAVQVHGGYGYIHEYTVERLMRDAASIGARAGGRDHLLAEAAA